MRLDSNSDFPSGMKEYLETYGWHFSKKMSDWAASGMKKEVNGKKESIVPYSKEDVSSLLARFGIKLDNDAGYDCVYVANMSKADFLGSSISDDMHLAKHIKDIIDDTDGYEGLVFTRFFADCIGKGKPIIWEDMM